MKATREQVNYRLPQDVVKALAKRAAKDKMSVTGVVEAALRVYLGIYPSWIPKGGARGSR
ncbi:MAG TPA: hypothetical protein VEU73_13230 [Gemmatimonadales bacterium]|nr:hypothetical protein [Gemmatimonadales bacterium]